MVSVPLLPSERVDDLLTNDLKIIQSDEVFSFSLDAVLLARFRHEAKSWIYARVTV
jgi:tRNA1(Val) A37 N6-methylase TrmN6